MVNYVLDTLIDTVGSIQALYVELVNIVVAVVMMSNMMVLYLLMIEGRGKHSYGMLGESKVGML